LRFCFERRALVFPPTSPTRHQLISGIGIPLALEHESITLGWVLKAQYFLPESSNQLKFNFFPDIFDNYTTDFLYDTKWHEFPNGRRRRDVVTDPATGQKYESFDAEVHQVGDEKLSNEIDDNEDVFDDEFEEDILERKLLEKFQAERQSKAPEMKKDEEGDEQDNSIDLSTSRWIIYDVLAGMLQR